MTLNLHPDDVDLGEYNDPGFVFTLIERAPVPDTRDPVGRLVLYRGEVAVVRDWRLVGPQMTDVLLFFIEADPADVRSKVWTGIAECRPIDGLGPLSDRRAVVRAAEARDRVIFAEMYREHVRAHFRGERWPYMEFARGWHGTVLERILKDLGVDSRDIVREVVDLKKSVDT